MKAGTILSDVSGYSLAEEGEAFDSTRFFGLPCYYDENYVFIERKNGMNAIYCKYGREGKKLSNLPLIEKEEYLEAIAKD